MNEIVSADALREQAATHAVASGRWEHGVLLALLRRDGAWWLVLWRGDGPASHADVARVMLDHHRRLRWSETLTDEELQLIQTLAAAEPVDPAYPQAGAA